MSRSTDNGFRREASGAVIEHGKVSRRQIFDRLFTERGAEVEWHDAAFAEEAVPDRFIEATREDALARLAGKNYIVVYGGSGSKRRLLRVIVLGPSASPEANGQPARTSPRRVAVSPEAMRRRHAAERQARADVARRQRAVEAARRRQAAQNR